MVSRAAGRTVNVAGLVQGIALVTFPAASAILTSRSGYDLTSGEYGLMFVPQFIAAILTSLLGAGLLWPRLTRGMSEKAVYLTGLGADLAAMILLIVSWLVAQQHGLAYGLLLAATACLGAGFGLTVPSLNTLTAAFHPGTVDNAVLVLNALLGLGTALAPAFVAAFNGLGFWIGLPLLVACMLAGLIAVSVRLPLNPDTRSSQTAVTQPEPAVTQPEPARNPARNPARPADRRPPAGRPQSGRRLPAGFLVFAVFAALYGFCETMNGNWSQVYMTSLGVRSATASLALTGFWAAVTVGRMLLAAVRRWLPSRVSYHCLPFLLATAFAAIAALPRNEPATAVAAFCLAGLGCSALLPLTISFGQEKLSGGPALVSGGIIACYQAGYGVAAFAIGPLLSAGIGLAAIFGASAAVCLVMGGLSLMVAHRRPSPATLHPRPAPVRQTSAAGL